MAIRIVAFDLYGALLSFDNLRAALKEYTPMAEAMIEAWRQRQFQPNAVESAARNAVWLNRRGKGLAPRSDRTIATLGELGAVLDDYLVVK